MDPYNSPHLALLKSATVAAIHQVEGVQPNAVQSNDADHPMLKALDVYSQYMLNNQRIPAPDVSVKDLSDSNPDVLPYMMSLQHQKLHAQIEEDTERQKQIETEMLRFKYGNPLWQEQQILYFLYYWNYPYHKGQAPQYRSWQDVQWGNNDPQFGMIKWKIPSNAKIALIGDIGTGTDIAEAVLKSALSFNPDLILHVGDIYYSGTPYEFQTRFTGMIKKVMQEYGKDIPVFTIPGNHEYFTGGYGFYECIDSNQLIQSNDQQQAASFFGLQTEDAGWQFLAMDTSFYGHYMGVTPQAQQAALELLHNNKVDVPADPTDPYWANAYNPMFHHTADANIAVTNPTANTSMVPIRSDEQAWHAFQIEKFNGRTVLLSHHQVYSAKQQIGIPQSEINGELNANDTNRAWINTELWKQFGKYADTKIAAWFWGHEHNLGVFQDGYKPADWPADNDLKPFAKGRCVGHSAIPVQDTETPYQQAFPVPLINKEVVLGLTNGWYNRGYQIMQLQGKGKPMQVSYYQISMADPKPIFMYYEEII
jgi:3',5'-cyclic AMP phosphodiesterase CpdA